jgi:hypothetical protein
VSWKIGIAREAQNPNKSIQDMDLLRKTRQRLCPKSAKKRHKLRKNAKNQIILDIAFKTLQRALTLYPV